MSAMGEEKELSVWSVVRTALQAAHRLDGVRISYETCSAILDEKARDCAVKIEEAHDAKISAAIQRAEAAENSRGVVAVTLNAEILRLTRELAAARDSHERLISLADMVARSDSVRIDRGESVRIRVYGDGGDYVLADGSGRTLDEAIDAVTPPEVRP